MSSIQQTFRHSFEAYCNSTNTILGRDALFLAGACAAAPASWLAWFAMVALPLLWADAFREQAPYLRAMRSLRKPEMHSMNILRRCSGAIVGFMALSCVAVFSP